MRRAATCLSSVIGRSHAPVSTRAALAAAAAIAGSSLSRGRRATPPSMPPVEASAGRAEARPGGPLAGSRQRHKLRCLLPELASGRRGLAALSGTLQAPRVLLRPAEAGQRQSLLKEIFLCLQARSQELFTASTRLAWRCGDLGGTPPDGLKSCLEA
ncbi:MAG: hypothetical protein J3K34DRAFT_407017 [Monoraphidium minutum]|nr:MAG: hypothetical protein J3K34DRAFT_407017 [Monoraphidium minutum]